MDSEPDQTELVVEVVAAEQDAVAAEQVAEALSDSGARSSPKAAESESELARQPWLKPGAWAKSKTGAPEPVWIAVSLQDLGVEKSKKSTKGKQKTKRQNKGGYSDEAAEVAVECGVETAVASEAMEPPRVAGIHVLPSIDKILRAAANEARLLKKRDMNTARVFLAFDAHGTLMETPMELISERDAQAVVTQDGLGVIIVPDGSSLEQPSDVLVELMQSLQLDLRQKNDDLESSRVARQQAREAESAMAYNGDDGTMPVLFWKDTDKNGYLSNWARSPFRLDGHQFNCAEQYIMWSKAVVMGDDATGQQVMATSDPQKQKSLGKQVHPWKDSLWKQRRASVMLAAARAKFTQNPALAERLMKTHPRRMAEASPTDRIYGIGLAPDNKLALDPRNWRGENLLGCMLEQVRQELLESEVAQQGVPTLNGQAQSLAPRENAH